MDNSVGKNDPPKQEYPDWQTYLKVHRKYSHLAGDGSDQLMVYRKNSQDDFAFSAWIGKLVDQLRESGASADVRIVSVCGTCENSLLLFGGEGIQTFIKTEAAKKGISNKGKRPLKERIVWFISVQILSSCSQIQS